MIPTHTTPARPPRSWISFIMKDWMSFLVLVFGFFVVGFVGFFAIAQLGMTSFDSAPTPTPVVTSDRELVIGMSEVVIESHRDKMRLRVELDAVKREAWEMIGLLVEEIDRIQGPCPPPDVPEGLDRATSYTLD